MKRKLSQILPIMTTIGLRSLAVAALIVTVVFLFVGCDNGTPTPTVSPLVPPESAAIHIQTETPLPPPPIDVGLLDIGGVPVFALVIVVVQIAKDWFGLSGEKTLRIFSFCVGVGFGLLHQQLAGWPVGVNDWIICVIRLLYGVYASAGIDVTRGLLSYAAGKG